MSRLPTEGRPGTNMDDLHCIAAADHAREKRAAGIESHPTEAERLRIERGEKLLRHAPEPQQESV